MLLLRFANGVSLDWKSVPAGNLALTAVAVSSDAANFKLASAPANIVVSWPTNVGQVTFALNDLQIPAAGLPIAVNRQYNTQYGTSGSFGNNGKIDYESIKIEKSTTLADGWNGGKSGINYYINEGTQHLITVSLSDSEKYYFAAQLVFDLTGNYHITAANPPDCYNFYNVHFVCVALGQGQMTVAAPGDTVGMDDQLTGWTQPLTAVHYDDTGFPVSNYEPDLSAFTFTTPDGTQYTFNSDGSVASKTDRNANSLTYASTGITRFGFDVLGHLVAVTNAFGTSQQIVTRYVYDEVGNMLQQIDGLNHTNFFEYNALGQRTKETQPGTQAQTFGYDAVGNLIRLTNFNSVIITNQYDALNRLTNKASVNYKVTFAYSPTGQRTNMTDASGTTSYAFDLRDRLQTKISPAGSLTYLYDGFGNLTNLQSATASGTLLTYNYDSLNRLTNAVDRFNNLTTYGFDSAGNLQTVILPNAVTNSYTYDSLNRLTNLVAKSTNGTVASFAYKLAPAGNRTNLVESLNGVNRTNTWVYDPLYRLTNEVITASALPTGTVSYKYDAIGNRTNRTSSVAGITNQTFVFNSNDQPTNDVFDSNGNTRTNSGNGFFYDAENRLTNAVVSGTNIVIVYDGDGNRVKKIVGTTTNLFLVDDHNPSGYAQVLEEKTVSGGTTNLVRLYTYGLDLISQRDASTAVQNFYGYDGNGNTRYLTATNAAITDTYVYDAFGVVITNTGTTVNFYRYSGEQYDPNLGFVYLRTRYMNPNSGRFMSRDTLAGKTFDPLSLHRYTYVANNPVNASDPSGQEGLGTVLTVVGIIIAVSVISYVGYRVYNIPSLRAARFESRSTLATAVQRNAIITGLGMINVHPRIQQLKGLLEDSENSDLTVFILPGTFNQGSHNALLKHKLFIPTRAFAVNDGGVNAAIFTFGEFQHDALGGGMNEQDAQKEIDVIITAIRRAKPSLNVPDYQHGAD